MDKSIIMSSEAAAAEKTKKGSVPPIQLALNRCDIHALDKGGQPVKGAAEGLLPSAGLHRFKMTILEVNASRIPASE